MILTSAVMASGALAVSVKAYRERKRKKETPWAVAAEKIGYHPLMKPKSSGGLLVKRRNVLNKLEKQPIGRFFSEHFL